MNLFLTISYLFQLENGVMRLGIVFRFYMYLYFLTCLCIAKPVFKNTIFVVTIGVICLNLKNFHTDVAHVLCYETFLQIIFLQIRK